MRKQTVLIRLIVDLVRQPVAQPALFCGGRAERVGVDRAKRAVVGTRSGLGVGARRVVVGPVELVGGAREARCGGHVGRGGGGRSGPAGVRFSATSCGTECCCWLPA